jgi:hypothetical protein
LAFVAGTLIGGTGTRAVGGDSDATADISCETTRETLAMLVVVVGRARAKMEGLFEDSSSGIESNGRAEQNKDVTSQIEETHKTITHKQVVIDS